MEQCAPAALRSTLKTHSDFFGDNIHHDKYERAYSHLSTNEYLTWPR